MCVCVWNYNIYVYENLKYGYIQLPNLSFLNKFFNFCVSNSFCCCSVTKLCPTSLWPSGLQRQASLSFPISWSLLKLISIESMMPSNHLILCHPLLFFPPVSWLFASGSQSIGASASASVLSMNIQGWFPLGLTDLISLLSKGLSRIFSSTTVQKYQFFGAQPSL